MRSIDGVVTGVAPGGVSRLAGRCAGATCRSCLTRGLLPVLDLGDMPLTSRFPTTRGAAEARFPLEVAFCPECTLMQVVEDVPTEEMFKFDYPYYSSFSQALLDHAKASAGSMIASRRLGAASLVIELASNDGYMLRNYVEAGIPALGIDPADGPAQAARDVGVTTICEFFTSELARKLAGAGERADVVLANNVMAHVPDLNDFVKGIATVLKPTGVAVIEVAYARDLVGHCEFDTIYHEHVCNYSVTAIQALFARHGLFVNHVEQIAIHGGSIRVFAEHVDEPKASVLRLLEEERSLGMHEHAYYATFGERVSNLTANLRGLVDSLRGEGQRVAAYGAAAKGVIMVGAAGLDDTLIDFVVDRNVHKHGKFLPGARIPVRPVEALVEDMPGYTLLLAWNFKEEIMRQQAAYRERGGKFIVPVPWPEVV
jgi:SAM-dependent methyltransferase